MRSRSHRLPGALVGAALITAGSLAFADPGGTIPPTTPDYPPGPAHPVIAPANFRPTWDLDGTYVWLGPNAAGAWIDSTWDSTFGGDLSIVRVREHRLLGTIGGSVGAARWTERGGGRIWVDALVGTAVGGHMVGLSAGPIVELSDSYDPRVGASVGLWAFVGITPYVRVGEIAELGAFAEFGLHIALPVFRH